MKVFLPNVGAPEDGEKKQKQWKCLYRQFLITGAGFLWGICSGANCGLSSIIFAQDHQNLNLTLDQESWIATIVSIALIPANLCVGWLLEKFGRRTAAGLTEMLNLLAWITTYFSNSYETLLAGRLLAGISNGMGYATYATYIGEVTSPKYRASCITMPMVGAAVGIFLIQFMGNYLDWNTVSIIFTTFPLCNLAALLYIRESHVWFINRNKMVKAKETFGWFKGSEASASDEIGKAIADVTQEQSYSLFGIYSLLKKRTFLIPFAITNVSYMTSEFSGIYGLTFYTSNILEMITNDIDYQYYANLTLNVGRVLGVLISTLVVKRVSVRRVLLVCTVIQGVLTLNLALFLYLKTIYPDNDTFDIVSLLSLVFVVLLFSIGLTPLSTVVSGELYPAAIRGIGFSLSATLNSLYLTILVKATPNMFDALGGDVTFLIFGCIALFGIGVLWFVLPNTKDKTLKEIENMFSHRK